MGIFGADCHKKQPPPKNGLFLRPKWETTLLAVINGPLTGPADLKVGNGTQNWPVFGPKVGNGTHLLVDVMAWPEVGNGTQNWPVFGPKVGDVLLSH